MCLLSTCVFSQVQKYLICRVCVCVDGGCGANKSRFQLVNIICSLRIPRRRSLLRAGSVSGSLPANQTPPLGANMLIFGFVGRFKSHTSVQEEYEIFLVHSVQFLTSVNKYEDDLADSSHRINLFSPFKTNSL